MNLKELLATATTVKISVESSSKPGCYYIVQKHKDGVLSCSCPAWRFQKSPAGSRNLCKHIKAALAGTAKFAKVELPPSNFTPEVTETKPATTDLVD